MPPYRLLVLVRWMVMGPSASSALPPGPQLPATVQALLMLRHGLRFLAACRRRYGPVFTLRIATMGTVVYLTDPADIKVVFSGDPNIFHAGEANSMLRGMLGDSSVLVIDGELHRDRHRLMLPPFHRDAVARQTTVMVEAAAANIAGWPVDTTFPVAPKMSEITLEVILRSDEYLDAVCKETLRVRTVVFDVGRVLKEPVELAGYRLPAGVLVMLGMTRVHTDGELYPEPERFDPDRMFGATPGQTTLSPTTWFPFGGGNRRCLGATFAMIEMRIILREILCQVELATTTAPGERRRLKHVIFVPHRGARVRMLRVREAAPGSPVTAAGPSSTRR